MMYVSIAQDQLPWLSAELQAVLRMHDRYRDPFTGLVEHEIPAGSLEIMHSRYPELAGHRRRYPIDLVRRQPRMITITI